MPAYNFESTKRFSSRARDYALYRPGYPQEVIRIIESTLGITPGSFVADVGAGTGIFARLLLQNGYNVICVEPNQEMLMQAEDYLRDHPGVAFTNGSGENTRLLNDSVDLVVIAQAFHWMDPEETRIEADRILKPGGGKMLLWNIQKGGTAFMDEYIALKEDYSIRHAVPVRINDEHIRHFFYSDTVESNSLLNEQPLNFDALKGQLLSSSYLPLPGDQGYDDMLVELKKLYDRHQRNDAVVMRFDTKLYFVK